MNDNLKIKIVDGNDEVELSTAPKENVKAYMVKGEPGTSSQVDVERSGSKVVLTTTDARGTNSVEINDGVSPTINTSKENKTTTVTIEDIEGIKTTEIHDGIDLTGGVPTNGVIGFNYDEIIYTCDGTETGDYYFTYNNTNYYFTMPNIEEGDILSFNTTDLELSLDSTVISTSSSGTGTELTFEINLPNGYEQTNEPFPGSGGTSDYENLQNRPQINGVTLEGNLSLGDLGVLETSKTTSNDKTYTCNYINGIDEKIDKACLYSLSEVNTGIKFEVSTGVFKDIYRKVVYFATAVAGSNSSGITNCDMLLDMRARGTRTSYTNVEIVMPMVHPSNMSAWGIGLYDFDKSTGDFIINLGTGHAGSGVKDLYVTFEYLKSN